MQRDDIVAIIQCFESSSAVEIELETPEGRLRLSREGKGAGTTPSPSPSTLRAQAQAQAQAPASTPIPAAPGSVSQATPSASAQAIPSPMPEGHQVLAPMVGTFYSRPAPDAAPFVEVGAVVRRGDTLCLIEVMKVLNTIVADREGRVAAMLVDDASLVEYGQALMVIAPEAAAA